MGTTTLANLTAVVTLNNTKFKRGVNDTKKSLGGFQKAVKSIGPMIAGAFAVGAIANFAKEASRAAAEAEGIERAFQNINKPGLLSELRTAVKGTVSDVRLMQAAVKANNFKIPLEQLGGFFKFAQQRAVETGESVDYLVESITNGIARKSLPILDNLGLSATEVREEFAKTGDMATAVGNIIARDMGDTADATLTTAELFDQAAANAANLKVEVGQVINLVVNKMLPYLEKAVGFLRQAFLTERMIKRQAMEANTLYSIEQDRAEVALLATKYKERGLKLDEGQTFEQRAALGLLNQYRTVLVNTNEDEQTKIDTISAQIIELEYMAGIKPKPGSISDPKTFEDVTGKVGDLTLAFTKLRQEIDAGIGKSIPSGKNDIIEYGIALMDMDEEIGTVQLSMEEMKDAGISLSDELAVAFAQIGSAFAQSLGEVAAGSKTFGKALQDISAMILGALGDILIMVGMAMTPIGIPLVLAGLALKFGGALVGAAGGKRGMAGDSSTGAVSSNIPSMDQSMTNEFTIRGTDLVTVNKSSTGLLNRLG